MDLRKVVLISGIIMPLTILGLGIFILVSPRASGLLPQYNSMFGAVLVAYSLFRGIRVWQSIKKEQVNRNK